MKNRILLVILATLVVQLFAAVVPGGTLAAEEKTLDLAALPIDQVSTRPGGPGAYEFKIVNRVPSFKYTVSITRTLVTLPALPVLPRSVATDSGGAGQCEDEIKALDKALADATTEVAVQATGVEHIGKSGTCKDAVTKRFEDETVAKIDGGVSFSVGRAETLTVIVSRTGGSWTYVLEGTAHGQWRTSYGFFFVPDRDKKYFTEPKANTTIFTIREQADREVLDFVPTILFTFLPNSEVGQTWSDGWTAGLGYDLEKPVLVAGYARAYNENLIFTAGVAFHRQTRLLGKYKVDGDVDSALESSQLVEDTYGPNIYAGVSFRFGEDIHARRQALERETAAAKAETAAAKARAALAEKEAADRKAACEASADKAEADAKVACKADADCISRATLAATEAKKKCAVTDQERRAAEGKEKRTLCDDAAKAQNKVDLNVCNSMDATKQQECKDKADSTLKTALLKCVP